MKPPISYRKHIPLFWEKSASAYRKDKYERYDEMVLRQAAVHLADEIWERYPMQAILDLHHHIDIEPSNILDIGCGVGRWIADLAIEYPNANCWGIDYSYQMLKQANDFWVLTKDLELDLTHRGFSKMLIPGQRLTNLNFGLAKAEELPFDNASQDIIVTSFLLDRVDDPMAMLAEAKRVLSDSGKLLLVSPLNFQEATHWKAFVPAEKFQNILEEMGWEVEHWQDELILEEPLDARGNTIKWKCVALVASKKIASENNHT